MNTGISATSVGLSTTSAVITRIVWIMVLDTHAIRPRVVLEQRIQRRVKISETSAEALVRGYNQALGEILGELASAMTSLPRQ